MKRYLKRALWSCIAVAALVTPASAAFRTFTLTGSGQGTLNGQAFPLTPFVLTTTADTDNRRSNSSGWSLPNTSASISIQGVGDLDLLVGTSLFVNRDLSMLGFGRWPSGGDLIDGPTNDVFSSWDMLTTIGPVSGTGCFENWSSTAVNTSGGVLWFNGRSSTMTFTADTPEPGALSLLALSGLMCLRGQRNGKARARA